MRVEVELKVITDATLDGYRRGLEDGRAQGEEAGQARIVRRLKRFRGERSKTHDVGGPVLDEAIARCSATVESVTPGEVSRG
jgi:hypothetical protein